jgi:hypothetical protein
MLNFFQHFSILPGGRRLTSCARGHNGRTAAHQLVRPRAGLTPTWRWPANSRHARVAVMAGSSGAAAMEDGGAWAATHCGGGAWPCGEGRRPASRDSAASRRTCARDRGRRDGEEEH